MRIASSSTVHPCRATARGPWLGRDDRGGIAIMAAITVPVLLFFAGLTIDLGLALLKKRQLQAATDMAALAAVQNLAAAQDEAGQMLAANGFAAARVTNLTTGSYVPNARVPAAQRYTQGASPQDAVQISTDFGVPLHFVRALVPNAQLTVPAMATSARLDEAGLVAGSGLAAVSGGLPNAILGGMLGTQVSLDAVSYNGLATAQVNALGFLNALATQMHVSAGTYGQLLSSNVSVATILRAEASALASPGSIGNVQATSALQSLAAQIDGAPSIALGSLVSAGIWQNAPIGSIDPKSALQARLNAYQLVTFAAQIADGSHLVSAPASVNIPGVASVDVMTTVIEPPQGSYFTLGLPGITVHTSQVRLLLNMKLLGTLPLGLGAPVTVGLQLYVEVADGTATLTSIACTGHPSADTTVGVSARSGVANAYVGTVSPASAMTNFDHAVTISPATILTLAGTPLLTGAAQVAVQGNTQQLTFTQAQIDALQSQRISSTNMSSNLLGGLASSLSLSATPALVLPVGAVAAQVNALLAPAFAGLDTVADQALSTLGVQVGYLDVTVTGDRCGVPALIQ